MRIGDAPGWTYKMLCFQTKNPPRWFKELWAPWRRSRITLPALKSLCSRFWKPDGRPNTCTVHGGLLDWSPQVLSVFFHLLLYSLVLRLLSDCFPPSCQTCQGFSDCLLPRLHKLGKDFRQMPHKTGQAKQNWPSQATRNQMFIFFPIFPCSLIQWKAPARFALI